MNVLAIFLLSIFAFYLAVKFYGLVVSRWLGVDDSRVTPANCMNDGKDYVPTDFNIVFGHHFSAIAGAGPIVGPTVAILFGYLPVWLWIIIGAIFIGAVHDFASIFVSIRQEGKSIAEVIKNTLGKSGFFFFICFTILLLVLVTSAFLSMTVQTLTSTAPLDMLGLPSDQNVLRTVVKDGITHGVIGGIASTSVILITLFAPILGLLLKYKYITPLYGYFIAAFVAVSSMFAGIFVPVSLDPKIWMIVLSIYVTLAAGLPVWLILLPRDFTNVQIMYLGIIGIFFIIILGGIKGIKLQVPALAMDVGAVKLGSLWPFLFITVACGAVSGFHSLVASGTVSKQICKESDARKIGYNGMILEAVLAIGAMLVVGAALSQQNYLNIVWPETGASNPILAFALSMGLLMQKVTGIPVYIGSLFGILMVEGFVVTTLDAAVRLNRYLFEELWSVLFPNERWSFLDNAWFNSGISVVLMLWLGWNNAFTVLWPLFATCNQLLAALALLAVSAWLLRNKRQAWFTVIPSFLMIVTTVASLLLMLKKFIFEIFNNPEISIAGVTTLIIMDIVCLCLAMGVTILASKTFLNMNKNKAL